MKPSIYKQYGVKKPQLNDIIVPVVKIIFNDDIIIKRLACVSKSYNAMINDVLAFADGKKDFTPLLYPRLDYESQTNIQQDRVEMTTALLVHYNMDPGLAVRFLGGEYTGEDRDIEGTCSAIAPYVKTEDLKSIERILMHGCPAEFQLTETSESKFEILRRGNH